MRNVHVTRVRQRGECDGAVVAHDADGAVRAEQAGAGGDGAPRRQRRLHLRCHRVHYALRVRVLTTQYMPPCHFLFKHPSNISFCLFFIYV